MPVQLRSSTSLQVVSQDTRVNRLRLSSSSPAPSSSTSTASSSSTLKRKLSNIYADPASTAAHPRSPPMPLGSPTKRARVPPPPLEIPSPTLTSTFDLEDYEPASPAPTEIAENDDEDFSRKARAAGVKVRDYAYEPAQPPLAPVPEVWKNPFYTLLMHDMHLRRPRDRGFCLPGRVLRRLLDIGFVTQAEADAYWTQEDRELLAAYDKRGHYPYIIACPTPKPTAEYRIRARKEFHGEPLPGDIPDASFAVPDGEWEGDATTWMWAEELKAMRAEGRSSWSAARELTGLDSAPLPAPGQITGPTIFPLSNPPPPSPPRRPASLPSTPASTNRGLPKPSDPSTPTTPPAPSTPTTPTTPPVAAAPLPSNRRGLRRTETLAVVSVR